MPTLINMIFSFFNINKKASQTADPFIFQCFALLR